MKNDDLLQAIELALAGEWDAALHKIEGDPGNAHYWYRRADRMEHVEDEPRAELAAIKTELATDEHR